MLINYQTLQEAAKRVRGKTLYYYRESRRILRPDYYEPKNETKLFFALINPALSS